jgi:hypothetical protein
MVSDGLNEGVVGDTAKLVADRLIARMLRRDPSLVERARPLMPAKPSSQLALRARVGGPPCATARQARIESYQP